MYFLLGLVLLRRNISPRSSRRKNFCGGTFAAYLTCL